MDAAAPGRRGLVKGKTVGIDATTLEANAALRSIVRRDTGESYQDFLDEARAGLGHRDADARGSLWTWLDEPCAGPPAVPEPVQLALM